MTKYHVKILKPEFEAEVIYRELESKDQAVKYNHKYTKKVISTRNDDNIGCIHWQHKNHHKYAEWKKIWSRHKTA